MRLAVVTAAVLIAVPVVAQPVAALVPAVKGVAAAGPAATAAPDVKPTVSAPQGKGLTPNAERGVTIGAIDKRTGATRTYEGHPGQTFKFGALTVTVRTCETTPPWEQKLTGAFLLIDETIGKTAPHRIYSGWMFGESPSLHPLEHARYDIWVKSCTMRFPETGPDTIVAGSVGGSSDDKPKPSKAKKSAETPTAAAN